MNLLKAAALGLAAPWGLCAGERSAGRLQVSLAWATLGLAASSPSWLAVGMPCHRPAVMG